MTSSATQDFLSEIRGGQVIPTGKLGYFRTRLAGRVHQVLLKVFGKLEREQNLTRRELAKRIHRKPEQITRWLSYPSNLTLDTASDLFIGLGYEIEQIILVDVSTGQKLVLPQARSSKAIFDREALAQRLSTDGEKSKEGKVIDLMEALRASVEKSQRTKTSKSNLEQRDHSKRIGSALAHVGIAEPHIGEAGLAAQNQFQLRPITYTLGETA
jgi:hypothetical protein